MNWRPRWSTITIALAVVVVVALVTPALGGPSLKSLVKKEVAKQISKATGPAGAAGATGTAGAAGTARAYGLISSAGAVSQSKNVTGVSSGGPGVYCIALAASIDPSTTGAVATPDFSGDSTNGGNTTHVEFRSDHFFCPAGRLEVDTWKTDTSDTTPVTDPQGGTVNAPTYNNTFTNQAFFFMVP